jgi:GNAT superfamily N-acetyltransferase
MSAPALSASPLSLAPVSAVDIDSLFALRTLAMRDTLPKIGNIGPHRVKKSFLATFDIAVTRHIIHRGLPIGFVAMHPIARGLLLSQLHLHPDHHGSCLGSVVMRALIAKAAARNFSIHLTVLRGSAAIRFYQRYGFIKEGEDAWDIYYVLPVQDAQAPT